MTATGYEEYREVLERVPHIRRVEIGDDGLGHLRVQIVSKSAQSPRHVVREIISLLRSAGWRDIKADNIVMVQIQPDDEGQRTIGRLRIAGYSVTFGTAGYEATCRLTHGSQVYEGIYTAVTTIPAVAEATLAAVNQALGSDTRLRLIEATEIVVAGVSISLALVADEDGEVVAGNAVQRDVPAEEIMMRAVLDAINRRFILYRGQKV